MFNRLLPRLCDNTYHGSKLALWLFALLVLIKVAMSLNSVFNGYSVASVADGFPLDTFTPAGAQAVVSMFAAWGMAHLIISLMCIVVLVRYRALIPFMFVLLLLEQLGRRVVFLVMPVVGKANSAGFYINLLIIALLIVGLVLSLRSRIES